MIDKCYHNCSTIFIIGVFCMLALVQAELCDENGRSYSCMEPQRCCSNTCCIPTEFEHHYHTHLRWSVWNMWYFWFVVLFVLMSCFGGCSYYRRHQLLMARQQSMIGSGGDASYSNGWHFPRQTFPISLFTGLGTRNSHQRAPHPAPAPDPVPVHVPVPQMVVFPTPPPYAEVMSQPEAYPLNKDDLPPYPGPRAVYNGTVLPPYSSTISPLPPYTPCQDTAIGNHSNASQEHPPSTNLLGNRAREDQTQGNQDTNVCGQPYSASNRTYTPSGGHFQDST